MADVSKIIVGGVEYQTEPLRRSDWTELVEWAQELIVDRTMKRVGKLPASLAPAAAAEILARVALYHPGHPDIKELISSPSGVARMLWLGARRLNPTLTLEAVEAEYSTGD